MASRANHRITKTRYYVIAVTVVITLSVILYIKIGSSASTIVIQGIGTISLSILVGAFIFEKWLWKTKIGLIIGCPPDYSGSWKGYVKPTIGNYSNQSNINIEVIITQNLLDIQWHQIGYNQEGKVISESHLIFGEVIDNHIKWGSICGLYEVTLKDKDHIKLFGSQLVDVAEDHNSIDGSYCTTSGSAGIIYLEKV